MRADMSSLDLMVKDDHLVMVLLKVASQQVYKDLPEKEKQMVMSLYLKLKFKMKVGHTCWKR